MMLASDKQYVKNKTRMRDKLRRQESGSIRNNSGKMRNIPSRSSMGPSIVRDDSDEDDIIPVSRSRRTSRSCDLTRKTSPSVDKKLKVRTTSQSQDISIVQNVTPSPPHCPLKPSWPPPFAHIAAKVSFCVAKSP